MEGGATQYGRQKNQHSDGGCGGFNSLKAIISEGLISIHSNQRGCSQNHWITTIIQRKSGVCGETSEGIEKNLQGTSQAD